MLDAAATARLLRLDVRHVQRLARQGRLPGRRVGRKWLFYRRDLERLLEAPPGQPELERATVPSDLSARNRLHGRVRSILVEGLLAEVVLSIGDQEIVAVITRSSVERLGLRVGDAAAAVMKSTEVMIAKE